MEKPTSQSGSDSRVWYRIIGVGLACALLALGSASATVTHDTLGNTTAIKRNTIGLITYPAYAGRSWTQRIIDFDGAGAVTLETTADRDTLSRRINQLALIGKLGGTTSWSDTIDYTRDDVGNPTDAARTGHPLTANDTDYDYDNLHRVEQVTRDGALAEDFTLDVLGNRVTYTGRDGDEVTYTHNLVNEYLTVSTQTAAPVHDANGNLVVNDRGFGFEYDYENRLSTIYEDVDADGALDPGEAILATYTYDALGRRTSETRTDAVANTTTLYIYDDSRIIAEYDAAGTLERYYVHGETYVDEHAVVHEAASGEDFAYSLDDMYNVVGLVDDDGDLVAGFIYDAYGLPQYRPLLIGIRNNLQTTVPQGDPLEHLDLDDSGFIDLVDLALAAKAVDDLPNPADGAYTFQGRRLSIYQTASGQTLPIYDFRARAYDPILGRFMQHDPAEYIDSYNLYLALLANPLTGLDPTGESVWDEDVDDFLNDWRGSRIATLGYIHEASKVVLIGTEMAAEIALSFLGYDTYLAAKAVLGGEAGFWDYVEVGAALTGGAVIAWKAIKWGLKQRRAARGIAGLRRITVCFVAGTQVLMGDGTLKAIDQLYPGAVVASKQEPSATEATDRGSAATIRERDKKFEARSNSPYPDDYDEIDPRNWRAIKLTLDHGNGQTTAIELLRPVPWVAFLDARIGGAVELQIPEMGVAGWAKVIAIEPCPTVEAPYDLGSRQIIGQFVTTNATIIDLFIQGVEEAIGTTPSHPFWSIDRGGWVEAGDLRKGEKLQTLKGTATVETVKARPGTRTVYNIEIHKDHTFFVSSAHLWVHNQCMRDAKEALRKNDDFRKWFHKNYAPEMKGGSLDENPDLPDEDILDAFLEWLELGRPKAD